MKVLYFDVETTGLDPIKDHIFQLSGFVEIDGEIKEEFNYLLRPPDGASISLEALRVTNKTIVELRAYPEAFQGYWDFRDMLYKYVDRFKKDKKIDDKFYPCAYNGSFDLAFVDNLFKRFDDKYFGAYQNWQLIDPLQMVRMLSFAKLIDVRDHKLSTLCQYFNIPIQAHDAMSDVRATRDLVQLLQKHIQFTYKKGIV